MGLLKLLSWKELETLVCGKPILDIELLKENTVYRVRVFIYILGMFRLRYSHSKLLEMSRRIHCRGKKYVLEIRLGKIKIAPYQQRLSNETQS
jgi:hypothetical protein